MKTINALWFKAHNSVLKSTKVIHNLRGLMGEQLQASNSAAAFLGEHLRPIKIPQLPLPTESRTERTL